MDFATKCRIVRVMLNMRQVGLAQEMGVTKETVSYWETGHREPSKRMQKFLTILAERNGIVFNERGYPEYAERKGAEPSA